MVQLRFRTVFLGIGSLLVWALIFLSDPASGFIKQLPFGSATLSVILNLVISLLYIGLLHLARKALVDYIDLEDYFKKALESSQGAGLALIGVALMMLSISLVILASALK